MPAPKPQRACRNGDATNAALRPARPPASAASQQTAGPRPSCCMEGPPTSVPTMTEAARRTQPAPAGRALVAVRHGRYGLPAKDQGCPHDMTGEYRVAAPQKEVWDALNDPDILKQCISG